MRGGRLSSERASVAFEIAEETKVTRKLCIPFLLIAVVLMVPFAGAQHDHGHRPVHAVAVHSHPDADHVAVEDMHQAAARHFGSVHERRETYGTAAGWAHDWTLCWIDYEVEGGTARLYHITHRRYAVRYTAVWDGPHGRYHSWQRVH